jgi:hypothetical protein
LYDNDTDQAAIGEVVEDEPLKMFFVRDSATAIAVIENRSQWLDLDAFRFEGTIPLVPTVESLELAQLVNVTHFGGIKSGGYSAEVFKILQLTMDVDNLRYEFKAIRRRPPPPALVEEIVSGKFGINSRIGPHYNDVPGELFGVFIASTDAKKLIVKRTIDYGANWDDADLPNAPALTNDIESFDTFIADGMIHCATQEITTGRVAYHRFSCAENSWAVTDQEITASCNNQDRNCVSIDERYPDGALVVFFQGNRETVDGKLWQRGYYSIYIGSWSAPVLVTPDPGLQPAYWGTLSSNCFIQRVIAGRQNRLHFFWQQKVGDYVVNGAGGEWWRTLQEDLTFTSLPIRCSYSIGAFYYAPERNIGDPCLFNDRSQIMLLRKVHWGNPSFQSFMEGSILTENKRTLVDSYPIYEGQSLMLGITDIPSGALRAVDATIYCILSDHRRQILLAESTDEGATWTNPPTQAGPTEISNSVQVTDGTIIRIRGALYMTYFSGPDQLTFRWLRIDTLPYTG